jgi:gamma-glutamyltranspeptidase
VFRHLVDENLEPADAVSRPRFAILADGTTAVEADYPYATELADSVYLMPPRSSLFGHAQAIVIDGPKQWRGGADPRSDGSVEYGR